ncbi:hypothetical protein G8C02_13820 [Enterococcus casseliflavus]|uniref:hypothetical protein n=1 Tax=Enterococcus casseliflavus TaxID=37734 RepID=UPI0018831673|nr:hypothetical protein [Enterococcus casseliflavus]MBE9908877.1 hypothetical protein [Enterococcus casseliflavus]
MSPIFWIDQECMILGYDEVDSFCVSNDVQELINKGLDQLTEYLCARNLIDDAFFTDEMKIWRM